jgi:hypothetical protein
MRSEEEMLRIVQARARILRRHRLVGRMAAGSAAIAVVLIGVIVLVPTDSHGRELRTADESTLSTTTTADPATITSPTDTTAPESSTTAGPTTSTQPSTVPPTSVASPHTSVYPPIWTTTTTPVTLCSADQVNAWTVPVQTTYEAGAAVPFDVHTKNVSDVTCPQTGWEFDVRITDSLGNVDLWLQISFGGPPYPLKPGHGQGMRFIWSQAVCPQPTDGAECNGPAAPPGVYTIHADLGGYVSTAQVTIS